MSTPTKLTRLLDELTGDDRETISNLISMLKEEEWLEDEIYNYCRLTEEVNPDLPEFAALQQMTFIAQKVRNRQNPTKEK